MESLPAFDASAVDALNKAYNFDTTGSCEIRLRWYEVALKPESGGKFKHSAAQWVSLLLFLVSTSGLKAKQVTDKGRMKFNRVIYRCAFQLFQS
jgi:hypothetical protein